MKPGDVVVLISGGEPMTVTELESEFARCQWFEKTADGRRACSCCPH
jgi:uncharacterized protein YodC (DUF2158 family)